MNAYSLDLRLKVLDAIDRGIPRREVVRTFGVSMPTIARYIRRRRRTGEVVPKPSPGRTPSILATVQERRALWKQLEENDEATLERHCELWEEGGATKEGLGVHHEPRGAQAGLDLQKSRWVPPSGTKKREMLGEST